MVSSASGIFQRVITGVTTEEHCKSLEVSQLEKAGLWAKKDNVSL